jgi:N-acyl-D-amino-acid deacylase
METVLLRNGTIIDGTGKPAFSGHVLIEDGSIKEVFSDGAEVQGADEVIDAKGCVVCPGFIDMHSHSDWLLPLKENPELLRCFIEQGITTIVAGNCGFSPAPMREAAVAKLQQLLALFERPPDFSWHTMAEFLSRLEEIGPSLNIAELVGHTSIRLVAADTLRGRMKPAELKDCLDTLGHSLDEGACGLSFGLGYEPGMYSPLDELEAFCKVAAEKKKPVTVHLKALSALSPTYPLTTFGAHNLLAIKEMIELARRTSIKLQLSHFIFVGRRSWWTADKAIRMVEEARRDGVDVMIDAFPYMCGNTTITVVLPHWFLKNTPEAYRNRGLRFRLKAELEIGFLLVGFTYKDFQVMEVCVQGLEDVNGLTIPEIAAKWNTSNFDALLRLCELSSGGTLMLFHTYSGEPGREEVIERVLSHKLCLFETDAVFKSKGYPNPAAKGTFPLILGPMVRERRLFSLEDAIKQSTYASAQRFGITDRGIIQAGKAADIVVFDPETISDTPPAGPKPAGRPKGIKHVFINGKHVVKDGSMPGEQRSGKVLRI